MDATRLVPIIVDRARITDIHLKFGKKKLDYSVTVDMYTAAGMKVTYFQVSSDSWQDKDKVEMPAETIPLAAGIRSIIETIVVRHINSMQKLLPSPEASPSGAEETIF